MGNEKLECTINGQNNMDKAINMISGKWKMRIVYELGHAEILRYGQLKKRLDTITHKMLSSQLKDLANDGIVYRNEYSQVPPKVEYSLTDKGKDLLPMFDFMCNWMKKYPTI